MKTLEELRDEWRDSYKKVVKRAKDTIVRWEFNSSNGYFAGPLANECYGIPRGRTIKDKSKAKSHYGYDAQGRIVYVWAEIHIGKCYEFCTFYENKVADMAKYESDFWDGKTETQLVSVVRTHFMDGRESSTELISCGKLIGIKIDQAAKPVTVIQVFEWTNDQLTRIRVGTRVEGEFENGDIFDIAYDDSGKIVSMVKTWKTGTVQRLIQKLPAGVTMDSLAKDIRERFSAAILATAARSKIKERIYAVALAYDGTDVVLPPVAGFGLESERKQWLGQKDAKSMIWNPAEWTHYEKDYTQLEDPKLGELVELFNLQLQIKGSSAPAKKLLLEVCRDLSAQRWPFPTTPDFIVYCVDFELSELNKNFKVLLSPARLAEFLSSVKKQSLISKAGD